MKKKIKSWGNSLVLVFTKEDVEAYGLVEGDVVDLDDMVFEKKRKKR